MSNPSNFPGIPSLSKILHSSMSWSESSWPKHGSVYVLGGNPFSLKQEKDV